MDLRCNAKLHGKIDKDLIEVRCSSRWCGKQPGVVVVHRFNRHTGELIETLLFKNPELKGNGHA